MPNGLLMRCQEVSNNFHLLDYYVPKCDTLQQQILHRNLLTKVEKPSRIKQNPLKFTEISKFCGISWM